MISKERKVTDLHNVGNRLPTLQKNKYKIK